MPYLGLDVSSRETANVEDPKCLEDQETLTIARPWAVKSSTSQANVEV